jgi:hypothetical protein
MRFAQGARFFALLLDLDLIYSDFEPIFHSGT